MTAVLDASVFVSAVSPHEVHHGEALRLMATVPDDVPYVVPAVFRVEVVAALARRGATDAHLDAVDARIRGPRFALAGLDHALVDLATALARSARLRGYDALYAAVALQRRLPLLNLDRELADRLRTVRPDVEVRTGADG